MVDSFRHKHLRNENPTPQVTAQICATIKLGATVNQACLAHNIGVKVVRRWYAEAEHPECPPNHPCAVFVRDVASANASKMAVLSFETFKLATQSKNEEMRFKAASWLLKTLDRDHQEVTRSELSGVDGAPIQIESGQIPYESLTDEQLLQQLALRQGRSLEGGKKQKPDGET